MKFTAIILAGGKSSRMGTDKGLVTMKEIPMVRRVIDVVKKTGISDIIIISNNPAYIQFGYPVYPDLIQNKGPLGGIYTGLIKSTTVKNLILSCDIPLISEAVLRTLIQSGLEKTITIVKYGEQLHHLIGAYDASLIKDLGEHIVNNKLKVGQFISSNNADIIDLNKELPHLESYVVANVNTMEELKKLEYAV